jgi:hypothetical protein
MRATGDDDERVYCWKCWSAERRSFLHPAGGKKGGKGDGAIGGWNFGGKYEMGLVKELEFSAWPIIKPVTS